MKKILILLLFCGFWANAQQYHDKGAKFEFATNEGDTITVNTRIPIIDEFGLINYYVDVADLLALNPAPVLEWGNITGTISDQTDLQGALNDKADQSALTAHTSNGGIHFTQSAISITESQVSDLKDYLRGDVNDTNGSNKLTLGSLEVVGQTTLQNGLNLTSIPVGTSDNILTLNQSTGDVEQRVFSLGDIDIANAAGTNQFPVGLGDQLRFEGSGDTSVSFDGVTNTVTITSVPGSGTGGAVTSFNGRTGGVVSQAGDYSTAMVNENTNLYFTEPRVRATPLTGLTVTNTPISSTNTFIQALGRLQGQINDRITGSYTGFDNRYVLTSGPSSKTSGNLTFNDGIGIELGTSSGNILRHQGGNSLFDMSTGNFLIRDGSTTRFEFSRTSGEFISRGNIRATGGTSALRIYGTGFGSGNVAGLTIYNKTASEIQGFFGFDSSNNSNLKVMNGTSGQYIYLDGGGGVNGLKFYDTSGFRTVYHSGNLRSDSQNDNRYVNNTGSETMTGYLRFTDNTALQFGSDNDSRFSYGSSNDDFRLDGGKIFRIRTTSFGTAFEFNPSTGNFNASGNITANGDVIANSSSDRRLKDDIRRIENPLKKLSKLTGNEFKWNDKQETYDVGQRDYGVIAQEVRKVLPYAVDRRDNGYLAVDYKDIIPLLIEAIKEQQIEIEQLKTMINEK